MTELLGDRSDNNSCVQLFNRLKGNKGARIFHVTGLNGIEGAGDAYQSYQRKLVLCAE